MTLHLKKYQKYDWSKLKRLDLLNETKTFNFDLTYFSYTFRYRVIQYLIGELSGIKNISYED